LIVYDCLFPYTVGGAERWYRNVAERLAADGHDVTYLTLRQWPRGTTADLPGVRVRAVGPRMALYVDGRRRIAPPLVFGAGVLGHLLRHRRGYDVVHTASFPYFSLLAAGALRRPGHYRLVVDWHELWSRAYWREYLGPVGGRIGWLVQRGCVRLRQVTFCFAQMTAQRLRESGIGGPVTVLEGEYAGSLQPAAPRPAEPTVVFAGRHIPEKRVPALVHAFAALRERAPELRLVIYGDGPQRAEVLALIDELGLRDVATAPGFVDSAVIDEALATALCMVLPSRREGYGLVVVEASARGVPSVVVAGPDNAATELVDEGENGFVARSDAPEELAEAILRVRAAGPSLRASTAAWFAGNAERLSLARSLDRVAAAYADDERPSASR
ncbi:MAG TPA: glycosyltransferase family 4 protein, partial [Solirubrobacteraceae bacterium]|nr:glycosyltransferase family 4 protein [Solirubrobacteraceae bacterium]